jgi:hypothetical protein
MGKINLGYAFVRYHVVKKLTLRVWVNIKDEVWSLYWLGGAIFARVLRRQGPQNGAIPAAKIILYNGILG